MKKIELIIQQKVEINALDLYQYENISLYNHALTFDKIRKIINCIARDKGYLTGIVELDGVTSVCLPDKGNIHFHYRYLIIHMIQRILRGYHEKKVISITLNCQTVDEFDCATLSKIERGIITKILKQENKRLARMGIDSSRKRKQYDTKLFNQFYCVK